jgi:hypothetical protein
MDMAEAVQDLQDTPAMEDPVTFEDYSDVGLTVKTTFRKHETKRDITIDVNLCRDDYGDILDVEAVSRDFRNQPAYKKLVEVIPDKRLYAGFEHNIENIFASLRDFEIARNKEAEENLLAAMARQEAYMMELCPDGNFDEYAAFIDQGDYVYFLVDPGHYVKVRVYEVD